MRNHPKTLITFLLIFVTLSDAETKIDCDFIDTVNISSGHLDQIGNFHHKGIIYKKEMFANFDYVVENLKEIKKVEPHVRGCVCKLKSCIRLCCRENLDGCVKSEKLSVPTESGNEEIDLKSDKFAVMDGWPCEEMYILEPEEFDYDKWYFQVKFEQNFRYFL